VVFPGQIMLGGINVLLSAPVLAVQPQRTP
jgi:hypothetical protein